MSRTLDLARQVGRWWAAAEGLVFVEADDATPGSVYACPLPEPSHRLATAASITIVASAGPSGIDSTSVDRRTVLVVEAHADDQEDALDMLGALRDLLRENDRPFRSPRTRGVIGLPPDAAFAGDDPVRAWRVLGFEIVNEPVPLRINPGDQTPDGQSSAQMTVSVTAVPATLLRAFDVTNEAGGLSVATVEVDPMSLLLNTSVDGGVGDAAIDRRGLSVDELASAVLAVGGGWTVDNENSAVDGEDAMNVIGFDPADANGVAKRLVVMTA